MTEKKRKKIIYVIFIVAIIWGIMNNPLNRKKKVYDSGADNPEQATITKIATAGIGTQVSLELNDQWGDDPFVQSYKTSTKTAIDNSGFNLSAISESGGEFWALINGQILAQGDTIRGWTVTKVTQKKAYLEKDGKTISLTIKG